MCAFRSMSMKLPFPFRRRRMLFKESALLKQFSLSLSLSPCIHSLSCAVGIKKPSARKRSSCLVFFHLRIHFRTGISTSSRETSSVHFRDSHSCHRSSLVFSDVFRNSYALFCCPSSSEILLFLCYLTVHAQH